MVCLIVSAEAQTRTITGKVTASDGSPVANASVIIKGTSTGTTTNMDGTFSLSVPASAKALIFSAVTMSPTEVTIGEKTEVNANLQPLDKDLQEVVVVGYGTQRRKDVTGNVAQISGTKLRDQPIQSFEQGLSGRAAGVNISIPNGVLGNPPLIRVRGISSISLSSYPLVVIDGVPSFTGDGGGTASNNLLGDINPSDIESMEVLKDASASAIYGSRASAGVLLITTKRGRQGRARVNYDGWAGWTSPYNLIEVLNAQEFTDLKNEGLVNAGTAPNGTTRGFYTMNDAEGNLIDTRWYDHLYRTGFAQNHSLSVSGATEKTNYYFSTGFTDQEGMFVNNDYKRMTGRFTLDHKVTDWFTVGGTFNYTTSENEGLNTGSTGAAFNTSGAARLGFALAPNVSPYMPDGTYNINGSTNSIGQGNNKTALAFTNPVQLLDMSRFMSKSDRMIANVYGQVRIIRGLNFKTLYGIDNLTIYNEEFRNGQHGDGVQFGGAAQNTMQRPRRWNWQNTLTYDTRIGDDHNLNILVGAEQQYTRNNSFGADRRRVSDPFFNEYQGGFTEIVSAGNVLSENFLQSYFSRINYDFKKKYFLSVNGRRDGYSAFSEKWGSFYGGSIGWVPSEEGFWKNSSIANTITSLKFRGSYGMVGNFAGVGNYAYQSLFGAGLYGADATVAFTQAGNAALTWETSNKLDFGFTIGFLDRFNLEFAYYDNDIADLILNEPTSPSRGIPGNSIAANIGSMVNKGIELTLSGTVISSKDFSWNTNFNITTVENEITALANNNADIFVFTGGLEQPSIIRVGESIGSFYAVRTKGINPANGQRIAELILQRDKNGNPSETLDVQYNHAAPSASRWTKVSDGTNAPRPPSQVADGQIIGPALPKYFGGFENTFRWKNFDFNILLYFSGGNYVYNGSKAGLHDNRNWNSAKDALNRWTKAGDNAEWPKVVFGDNVSNGSGLVISNNIEKGDFIKGRNIALGYTLPKNLLERVKINSIRVYVAAINAFTITNYSGFDPEIQSNGIGNGVADQVTNGAPSVDRNAAPLARTINVGINISF